MKKHGLMLALVSAFSISACGGGGGSSSNDTAPVVSPPPPPPTNTAPVANADTAETTNGLSLTIDVISNDSDTEGDSLTIESVSALAQGTVTIENNTLVYTPESKTFSGQETFNYVITDGELTSEASVTVTTEQHWQIEGLVASSANNLSANLYIDDQSVANSPINPDGSYSLAYTAKSPDMQALAQIKIMQGNTDYLSGAKQSLASLVPLRDQSGQVIGLEQDPFTSVTPLSTAYLAMKDRLTANSSYSFESQIDTDALLEMAALVYLIDTGELDYQGSVNELLLNDNAMFALSETLMDSDSDASFSSGEGGSFDGILIPSTTLSDAIVEISKHKLVLTGDELNNSVSTQSLKTVQSTSTPVYDLFQMIPQYQDYNTYHIEMSRITLFEDGTGEFVSDKGNASVSWENSTNGVQVNFDAPLSLGQDYDLFDLTVKKILSDDLYTDASYCITSQNFELSLRSIVLQTLVDGEQVNLSKTGFDYHIEAASEPCQELKDLGLDDYSFTTHRNQEYRDAQQVIDNQFDASELAGEWALAVYLEESDLAENSHTLSQAGFNWSGELITLYADGSLSGHHHKLTGSWFVNDEQQLEITQSNGWTLTFDHIDNADIMPLTAITAQKGNETRITALLTGKRTTSAIELSNLIDNDSLWNASWVMSNPNNRKSDGQLKDLGYFGFFFGDENKTSRVSFGMSFTGSELEYSVVDKPRAPSETTDGNLLIERRSMDYSIDIDCDPKTDSECIVFWQREWIPIYVTDSRIYVMESISYNFDLIYGEEGEYQLLSWPFKKAHYYEKVDFPEHLKDCDWGECVIDNGQ